MNASTPAPQHEDILMTIAKKLEARARAKGLEEGMLLGEQKGRGAERLETARKMLANGMDNSAVMIITGLTEDDLKPLCH